MSQVYYCRLLLPLRSLALLDLVLAKIFILRGFFPVELSLAVHHPHQTSPGVFLYFALGSR